jgi:hypothetical protein
MVPDALFIAEAGGIAVSLAAPVPEQDWYWYKVHFPSYPSSRDRTDEADKHALYSKDQHALIERLAAHGVIVD